MKRTSSAVISGNILFLHECFNTGYSAALEIRQRLPKYRFNELAGILGNLDLGDPCDHVLGRWKSWCAGPYHIQDIHKFGMTRLTILLAWLQQNSIKHRLTTEFSM